MKFTFKTVKPTGKYKSFSHNEYMIKHKKHRVGSIEPFPPFRIRLMIVKNDVYKDANPNCDWMWVTLKTDVEKFNSVDDAKKYINDHSQLILKTFNLKYVE